MIKRCLLIAFCTMWSVTLYAVVDGHQYPFDNDEQALRFKALASELRCPKCQNQNIADSDSIIAQDLRQELYEMVQSGKTDQDILGFMVQRYGDFVLYAPPVKTNTYFLWFGPLVLLLLLLLIWVVVIVRKRAATDVSVKTGKNNMQSYHRLLSDDTSNNQDQHSQ